MSRRRLASLAASLAAHGAGLLLVFALVAGESVRAVLFVDLTREPASAGASEGATAPAPTPAARPPAPRGAARVPAPDSGPRGTLPEPSRPAPAAEPAPAAARVPEEPRSPVASAAAFTTTAAPAPPRAVGEGAPASAGVGAGGRAGAASDVAAGAGLGLGPSAMAGPGGAGRGAARGAPGGTGRDALAAAAPASAAPAAEYGAYLAEVRRRIQEALRYPLAARRRGLAGTVQLEILIRPDGAIDGVNLAAPSAHRVLDEAALEAVRGLAPVPFPAGVAPRPLRVRLPVVFELR